MVNSSLIHSTMDNRTWPTGFDYILDPATPSPTPGMVPYTVPRPTIEQKRFGLYASETNPNPNPLDNAPEKPAFRTTPGAPVDFSVDYVNQRRYQDRRFSLASFETPYNPPRRFYFEASPCCSTPQLRIYHECCNKESRPREIVDERPLMVRRNLPPVSSRLTLCRFCLKNGEPPSVYYGHNLHSEDGTVQCPVLRNYDCPVCRNGGGDYAHTVRYCPTLRANSNYARG